MKRKNPDVFGPFYQHVIQLPCIINDGCCYGKVEGHHVKSRGAGGTDTVGVGSHGNLAPLCTVHHYQGHSIGWLTFQKRHGVDLQSQAENIYRHWVGV